MSKKLEKRNTNIREYHIKHPKTSIRAIGRVFHLSHVRILQILRDGNNYQRRNAIRRIETGHTEK